MVADSVALPRRAAAARWSTTPSTSSTATRPTATTPWPPCARPVTAGARTLVLCDTNGGTLTDELVADRRATRSGALGARRRRAGRHLGHPHPQRRRAGRRQLAGRGRRPACATSRARSTATASAAATPTWSRILADLALKTGRATVPAGGRPGRPDRAVALRRRDRQRRARRLPAVRRPIGVRPQGRRPRRGRRPRSSAATSTSTRPSSATRRGSSSASSAAGPTRQLRAEQLGHAARRRRSTRASCRALIKQLEADGAGLRGRRGLVRAADPAPRGRATRPPFRLVDFTVLVEQRDGAELLAEATVKVEVAGEVLHTAADGNGPVNALDAALRKALGAFYPRARRGPPGRLQGPHPRRRGGHRRPRPGSSSTRPTARATWSTMGSDTNIIAASLAGAGRLARVRDLEGRAPSSAGATSATSPPIQPEDDRERSPSRRQPTRDAIRPSTSRAGRCTTGSNVQSRGVVVVATRRPPVGRHRPRATGRSTRCSGRSTTPWQGVLPGHPRLVAYDVHAVAEGPDAEGVVTCGSRRPAAAAGAGPQGDVRRHGHRARTSSRPRSRPTSRPSTACSPRRTGPARPRRPAIARRARAKRQAAAGRRVRRGRRQARHDRLVRALAVVSTDVVDNGRG